jgi:hypothetical protein
MHVLSFESIKTFLFELLAILSLAITLIKVFISEWRGLKRFLSKGHRKG